MKTYSNKSNALRALKTLHPELVGNKDNATLAAEYLVAGEDKTFAIVIPPEVKVVKRFIYKGVQFRRRSVDPVGITNAVHDMFDEYQAEAEEKGQTLTRKQYIARAVRDGVAYYTARTQYQKWSRG
jgi:hypothetical protein